MVEKWLHASHDVILIIVALRNLRKRVLLTRHAAGPNCILDFTDRRCNQFCNFAGLHI